MENKGVILGMFAGAIIAIAAVVSHDRTIDGTPVYNEGYEDGFHDGVKEMFEEGESLMRIDFINN